MSSDENPGTNKSNIIYFNVNCNNKCQITENKGF